MNEESKVTMPIREYERIKSKLRDAETVLNNLPKITRRTHSNRFADVTYFFSEESFKKEVEHLIHEEAKIVVEVFDEINNKNTELFYENIDLKIERENLIKKIESLEKKNSPQIKSFWGKIFN